MEITDIIAPLYKAWPVLTAVLVIVGGLGFVTVRFVLPWALRISLDRWGQTAISAGVKASLLDGSGDIIRTMIRAENGAQTMAHVQHIQEAIAQHERYEDERWRRMEEEQLRHDDRIRKLETKGRRGRSS
jgi:hypothetical protein